VKLTCLQENLSKGLSVVGRAVATRSTLPVLSNILLSAEEGRLKLAATNLDIGINCWIGARVEEEGATTVPARLFTELVNSLPPEQIEMELTVRTQSLNLRCGRFEANVKGIDASEFPPVSTAEDLEGEGQQVTTSLKPELLRKVIQQVAFAAASEETHPFLSGALTSFEGDKLTLVATDGYRLSVRSVDLPEEVTEPLKVIVPARTLTELARIATEADEEQPIEIMVTPNRSQILFHLKGKAEGPVLIMDLVSQLIESTYPDYQSLIPKTYNTRTIVDREAFLKALKVAALFARDRDNMVRLQIAPGGELMPGHVTVVATSRQYGDNVGEVDASVEGSPLEIAFNVKYLIEVLSVLESSQVILETTTASSPGVIKPADGEEFIHVIMPMYLEEES